jgi:signal transduction histidine kinase
MNRFSDFSIKLKLIISVLSMLFVALLVYSSFILLVNYKRSTATLLEESQLQSQLISDYAVTPLLFNDETGAMEILNKLNGVPNINAAAIYDTEGKLFAFYSKELRHQNYPKSISNFDNSEQFIDDQIILTTPVLYNGHTYGAVIFYISTQDIPRKLMSYALWLFGGMFILILLSLFVIIKIQNYITTPIISLAKTAQEISLSEDYSIRAQKFYTDEVGHLYDDFNVMLERIEQRGRERDEAETISRTYQSHLERLTNELEERVKERTNELQVSLEQLQSAQSQLVESEKMSALGNLVAGVAHEVNTPLGISITAASIFKNEINTLKKLLDEEKLSKSALDHFIDTISEADDILIKNLDRAALLVRNFKKISVDQSSEEMRNFELNDYLQEVISTFNNELKHRPVELQLQLNEEPIQMHSYPGAISQIIVNLLQNALLHGFEYDQAGEITLKTEQTSQLVRISFCDNGKGVDENVIQKIFEPFVTTKRNKGGTGLGLNITYNLVTQHLKGSIRLDNTYTHGARFIIEIPHNISDESHE